MGKPIKNTNSFILVYLLYQNLNGTATGRNGLLYITLKFSHCSGSGTVTRSRPKGLSSHFCTFSVVHYVVISMCTVSGAALIPTVSVKTSANKKVLLQDRKRHTACRVASACCAVLSRRGEGVPQCRL